jgi:hypothetical protein
MKNFPHVKMSTVPNSIIVPYDKNRQIILSLILWDILVDLIVEAAYKHDIKI